MRVLIVEDDKLLSQMYKDGFELAGHETISADSAQGALNELSEERVDLILLDMFLPGRSGIEVLHELSSYADWQIIPVVLLSDIDRKRIKTSDKDLLKYGVHSIIYKPSAAPSKLITIAEEVTMHAR